MKNMYLDLNAIYKLIFDLNISLKTNLSKSRLNEINEASHEANDNFYNDFNNFIKQIEKLKNLKNKIEKSNTKNIDLTEEIVMSMMSLMSLTEELEGLYELLAEFSSLYKNDIDDIKTKNDIESNYNIEDNTFMDYLHEKSEFNKHLFVEMIDNFIQEYSDQKNFDDQKLFKIFKITFWINNSISCHLNSNDLLEIKNFPKNHIEFIQILDFVTSEIFKNPNQVLENISNYKNIFNVEAL